MRSRWTECVDGVYQNMSTYQTALTSIFQFTILWVFKIRWRENTPFVVWIVAHFDGFQVIERSYIVFFFLTRQFSLVRYVFMYKRVQRSLWNVGRVLCNWVRWCVYKFFFLFRNGDYRWFRSIEHGKTSKTSFFVRYQL